MDDLPSLSSILMVVKLGVIVTVSARLDGGDAVTVNSSVSSERESSLMVTLKDNTRVALLNSTVNGESKNAS